MREKKNKTYKQNVMQRIVDTLLKVYMTLIENKFNNHRYTQINFQVIGGFWLLFFRHCYFFYSMSYLCCVYLQINLFLQYLPETCISSEFKINSEKIGPTNINIASQQYIVTYLAIKKYSISVYPRNMKVDMKRIHLIETWQQLNKS